MEIRDLIKETRDRAIKYNKPKDLDYLSTSWYQEDLLYSGKGKTLFIIIPTPGCSWALSNSGGCSMCSYIHDCYLKPIDTDKIIELFEKQFNKYLVEIKEDYESGEKIGIKLFASGSFLNPEEVPVEARNKILEIINETGIFSEYVIETRPEYVQSEDIKDIFNIIGDNLLEISIGLETSNERTRLDKINKGFSNKSYEKAIEIVNKAKSEYNIKNKAYVFIKPVLTSEKESIDEAVETAKYAEGLGIDRISCCPATIHKGTLMERLWRRGSYTPPWIWTTVEVINKIRESVNIPSLLDTSGFGSRRGPYNCKKCNKDLKHLIISSNFTQNIIEYDCECKKEWLSIINNSNLTQSKNNIKHLPLY